jgi:hypothetical protein
MRARLSFVAAALLLAPVLPLRAGDATPADISGTAAPAMDASTPAPSNIKASYEFDADTSYVGSARTNFGYGNHGGVSEQANNAHFLMEPQFNDGPIYRFGLAYQRYNFGLSQAAPLPDILEAENLIVGMDFELFNSWLVRVEADPGFYSDGRDLGFRDFNVPIIIGGSYIASDTVQWVVGLDVDVNRQIPVIPAIGVHWSLNNNWVIDAVLPTPRIEYDWSDKLTLYLGGDFDDGTYRMDQTFATGYGSTKASASPTPPLEARIVGYDIHLPGPPIPIYSFSKPKQTAETVPATKGPNLNGAVVEYDEIRVGAGFSWKASKVFTIELEGGYLPYREFDFHRADVHFSNDDGAAYARMSINAQF